MEAVCRREADAIDMGIEWEDGNPAEAPEAEGRPQKSTAGSAMLRGLCSTESGDR